MDDLHIIKKQFIAGAVCPGCAIVDRIVVEIAIVQLQDEPVSRRRCVDCGFADEFSSDEKIVTAAVPKGKPEKPRVAPAQSTVVRVLEPVPPKSA